MRKTPKITARQEGLANRLNAKVQEILDAGGSATDMLVGMQDYMSDFHCLLQELRTEQMEELTKRLEGLHYFAKLLEKEATKIVSGEIKVS